HFFGTAPLQHGPAGRSIISVAGASLGVQAELADQAHLFGSTDACNAILQGRAAGVQARRRQRFHFHRRQNAFGFPCPKSTTAGLAELRSTSTPKQSACRLGRCCFRTQRLLASKSPKP